MSEIIALLISFGFVAGVVAAYTVIDVCHYMQGHQSFNCMCELAQIYVRWKERE